jgi:hypothetical protein
MLFLERVAAAPRRKERFVLRTFAVNVNNLTNSLIQEKGEWAQDEEGLFFSLYDHFFSYRMCHGPRRESMDGTGSAPEGVFQES